MALLAEPFGALWRFCSRKARSRHPPPPPLGFLPFQPRLLDQPPALEPPAPSFGVARTVQGTFTWAFAKAGPVGFLPRRPALLFLFFFFCLQEESTLDGSRGLFRHAFVFADGARKMGHFPSGIPLKPTKKGTLKKKARVNINPVWSGSDARRTIRTVGSSHTQAARSELA